MFNLSKHAQGALGGALDGLEQATSGASTLIDPNEQTNLSSEDLKQGLTGDQAGAAFDAARVAKWNKIVSRIGDMPPEVMNAIERMPEFQTWQPKIENASVAAPETLVEEGIQGAEMPIMGTEDFDQTEQIILSRANELKKQIENRQDQQATWNQQAYQRAATFNLKRHKKFSQVMPQPMGAMPIEQPMGAMPMEQPEQQIEGQSGRFPVENEGDFISKFADDLLVYNNRPGTQEYERARMAAEEIRDAVSPGFEEEANSILESVMQLDVTQRDQASNYLMKLYEVLIPPMLKGDQTESQMEPVMSEKKQDAVEGIVRFSLTDSVLNNKPDMTKIAADQFGQQYMLYGPTEKRICPKLRGKNLSVGDVVSEYTCRHHCIDGLVIDDNKTICGEALWRANAMDKYSREYVNEDGDIVGGYINKRFEVNRNVQEENKMRLKPGETRKPRPAAWGNTESRLQDMRSKEGQARDYRPETNTGDPFDWCHDVDQNNVGVSQAERDRREEAAGHKLVQYTNRDQAENNPVKTAAQYEHRTPPRPGSHEEWREQATINRMKTDKCKDCGVWPCRCDSGDVGDPKKKKGFNLKQFKTAQSPVNYKPMDTHQTAINKTSPRAIDLGVSQPPNVEPSQGLDSGKPMIEPESFEDILFAIGEIQNEDDVQKISHQADRVIQIPRQWEIFHKHLAKRMSELGIVSHEPGPQPEPMPAPMPAPAMVGFNLKRHKKEAECPVPHTTALPDHDYFRQNKPQDGHDPDVKPKKKT